MKFIKVGNEDFQLRAALNRNTSFGNFIIPISQMPYFEFYTNDGTDISSEDFYLQRLRYNSSTGEYYFYDYLQLNNTYRNAAVSKDSKGYFEEYDFASDIDIGCYRIKAGDYYSVTLCHALDIDLSEITGYVALINNLAEEFIDNTSDPFVETN